MKQATGLLFGRLDSRDSKPVAFFTGLGRKPVKKATGLSLWLLHRLVHYWQTHLKEVLLILVHLHPIHKSKEEGGGEEEHEYA